MILACPKCGTENHIPDPPDPIKKYICDECNTRLLVTGYGYSQVDARPILPFASTQTLAQWVTIVFVLLILVGVIAIVSNFAQVSLLSRVIEGEWITWEEATANDDRQAMIAWAWLLVYVVAAIAFCMWIYRANKNLPALGARHLKYSPGWAVGWFFVPIFSFFRPFQVVTEIWKASSPKVTDDRSWQDNPSTPLIGWWWALFLISAVVGNILLRWPVEEETASGLLNFTWVYIGSDFLNIIGAIVTIVLVRAISKRQEEKHKQLATLQPIDR